MNILSEIHSRLSRLSSMCQARGEFGKAILHLKRATFFSSLLLQHLQFDLQWNITPFLSHYLLRLVSLLLKHSPNPSSNLEDHIQSILNLSSTHLSHLSPSNLSPSNHLSPSTIGIHCVSLLKEEVLYANNSLNLNNFAQVSSIIRSLLNSYQEEVNPVRRSKVLLEVSKMLRVENCTKKERKGEVEEEEKESLALAIKIGGRGIELLEGESLGEDNFLWQKANTELSVFLIWYSLLKRENNFLKASMKEEVEKEGDSILEIQKSLELLRDTLQSLSHLQEREGRGEGEDQVENEEDGGRRNVNNTKKSVRIFLSHFKSPKLVLESLGVAEELFGLLEEKESQVKCLLLLLDFLSLLFPQSNSLQTTQTIDKGEEGEEVGEVEEEMWKQTLDELSVFVESGMPPFLLHSKLSDLFFEMGDNVSSSKHSLLASHLFQQQEKQQREERKRGSLFASFKHKLLLLRTKINSSSSHKALGESEKILGELEEEMEEEMKKGSRQMRSLLGRLFLLKATLLSKQGHTHSSLLIAKKAADSISLFTSSPTSSNAHNNKKGGYRHHSVVELSVNRWETVKELVESVLLVGEGYEKVGMWQEASFFFNEVSLLATKLCSLNLTQKFALKQIPFSIQLHLLFPPNQSQPPSPPHQFDKNSSNSQMNKEAKESEREGKFASQLLEEMREFVEYKTKVCGKQFFTQMLSFQLYKLYASFHTFLHTFLSSPSPCICANCFIPSSYTKLSNSSSHLNEAKSFLSKAKQSLEELKMNSISMKESELEFKLERAVWLKEVGRKEESLSALQEMLSFLQNSPLSSLHSFLLFTAKVHFQIAQILLSSSLSSSLSSLSSNTNKSKKDKSKDKSKDKREEKRKEGDDVKLEPKFQISHLWSFLREENRSPPKIVSNVKENLIKASQILFKIESQPSLLSSINKLICLLTGYSNPHSNQQSNPHSNKQSNLHSNQQSNLHSNQQSNLHSNKQSNLHSPPPPYELSDSFSSLFHSFHLSSSFRLLNKFPSLLSSQLLEGPEVEEGENMEESENVKEGENVNRSNQNCSKESKLSVETLSVQFKSKLDLCANKSTKKERNKGGSEGRVLSDIIVISLSVVKGVEEGKVNLLLSRREEGEETIVCEISIQMGKYNEMMEGLKRVIHSNKLTELKTSQQKLSDSSKQKWWSEKRRIDKELKELLSSLLEQNFLDFAKLFFYTSPLQQQEKEEEKEELEEKVNKLWNILLKASLIPPHFQNKKEKWKMLERIFSLFLFSLPSLNLQQVQNFLKWIFQIEEREENEREERPLDKVSCLIMKEFVSKTNNHHSSPSKHLVLILDENLQFFPFESIPSLREKSVSRLPSPLFFSFLIGPPTATVGGEWRRGEWKRGEWKANLKNAFYIVNPSKDLKKSEERMLPLLQKYNFEGIKSTPPTASEFEKVLREKEVLVYCGHDSGSQFLPSEQISRLEKNTKASLLMGCSSVKLKKEGEYEGEGAILSHLLSSCKCVVGFLWNVTDHDCDRLTIQMIEEWCGEKNGTIEEEEEEEEEKSSVSLPKALSHSRKACVLPYLNGAAAVCYGLPLSSTFHSPSNTTSCSKLSNKNCNRSNPSIKEPSKSKKTSKTQFHQQSVPHTNQKKILLR